MSSSPQRLAGVLAALAVCGSLAVSIPSRSLAKATPQARSARARYLSGRLNVAGYTVVVVGYNGKISSSHSQTFRLRAPTPDVTVQLISPKGVYAGPVVFGGSSSRAIMGVNGSVNLGTIDVVSAKGYARLARNLSRKDLDASRWAHASQGVPIGNGRNLGLIERFKGKKNGGTGPGQDEAHVGIPNEFDVAVPGTHIIAELAPARRAGKGKKALSAATLARSAGETASGGGKLRNLLIAAAGLELEMGNTVNEDAAGVTATEIDAEMQEHLVLGFKDSFTEAPSDLELDCNGLDYCDPGGTGLAALVKNPSNLPNPTPFPAISANPTTGFGEIVGPNAPDTDLLQAYPGVYLFRLFPHASGTTASPQPSSGDVITADATIAAGLSEIPLPIGFVFETVPAIASYADTAGNSGSVTYPDATGIGTAANPIKVAPGSDGDVVMTFTVYRPQRQGIPGAGEPSFMDIGNLGYYINPWTPPGVPSTPCGPEDDSNLSPTLSAWTVPLATGHPGEAPFVFPPGALVDSASDQPASSANTISFTVNVTKCLSAQSVQFPARQPVTLVLQAQTAATLELPPETAHQTFVIERTG